MQYPQFRRDGWPIGSGMVESANKNVVAARLKGTGMHWQRKNVNPMLALRNAVCNGRWREMWKKAVSHHRKLQAIQRSIHAEQRAQARLACGNASSEQSSPQSAVDTSQIAPPAPCQPISEAEASPVAPPVPEASRPNSSRPSSRNSRNRVKYASPRSGVANGEACPCGAPLVRLQGHPTKQYCSDRWRERCIPRATNAFEASPCGFLSSFCSSSKDWRD
jgi:hypothetical protein